MQKTLAAIGISAAIAFAPLAALAQTDTTAPAAGARHRQDGAGQGLDEEVHEAQEAHGQENEEAGGGCNGSGRGAEELS